MNTMKKCPTCGNLYAGDLCPSCAAGFVQKPTDPTSPGALQEELPLKPGETFHGLEIVELLGRGGMGVVFKARQPALDRFVALKILPKRLALDPDFQGRFIREAKALGALSHPNIVAVHDFGAEAGLFFFVMEFIDGVNLRQMLRDKKFTPEQAFKVIPQLCDALEFAHVEGVVHRDIKPENILIDKRGRIKIADFGLAKLTGADSKTAMLTMTNMVMGTPHYMAPEQVENPKGVDHRADIYSMGVVFYEMLTGELPIGRFEVPSKMVQIDVRLDEVVLRTLEKQPEKRYQSAVDVKNEVARITSAPSQAAYPPTVITPKPVEKKKIRDLRIAVVVLAVVLAAVPISQYFSRRKPPPDPGPMAAAPVDLTRLHFTPEERPAGYVWLSPDPKGIGIPRNPFPARDLESRKILVKWLDGMGLSNVAPEDIKQGYIAAWFQGTGAMLALETPIAERLEREFKALPKMDSKWSHRAGDLLVLTYGWSRDYRIFFAELVALVQKKLGLPVDVPDPPLENVKVDKGDLPKEWVVLSETQPAAGTLVQDLGAEGAPLRVRLTLVQAATREAADAREKEWPRHPAWAAARRVNFLRAGRLLAALSLHSDEIEPFEKINAGLRDCMGYPTRDFGSIVPAPGELPEGYSIEKTITEVPAVLAELALADLKAEHVGRAWLARLKPAGAIAVLEIKEGGVRGSVENQLKKRGAAEDGYSCVFGIEAQDDGVLDDLENRMRLKFGWSVNSPRAILLRHVRPEPGDFPAGYALGPVSAAGRETKAEIKGPDGIVLRFTARESHNYGERRKIVQTELGYQPGDILLDKYAVLVHVGGAPEAAWPALEAIEASFRRKLRMKAPDVMDFPDGLPGVQEGKPVWKTLWNTHWKTRAELNAVVRKFGLKADDLAAARASSSDKELDDVLLEFRSPEAVPAELPAVKGYVSIRRGPFLALKRDTGDGESAEALRRQLRAKR